MEEWKAYTKKLLESIHNSKEQQEYAHYKDKIMDNDELSKRVKEFCKESFTIRMEDRERWLNEYEHLKSRYRDIFANPDVEKYLSAQVKLCRLYRGIWETLIEDADIDVEFLNEIY